MKILSRLAVVVILSGFILAMSILSGVASTVAGTVTGADGKLLQGAEIRVEGKDGLISPKPIKTDARGRYSCSGLGPGTFHVTLIVNGETKAIIANVSPHEDESEKLNFEIQRGAAVKPFAKGRHYVLLKSPTGTHLDRWVEVDDDHSKTSLGAQERYRTQADKQMQSWQMQSGVMSRQ